jgi:hypothetical protein
VCYQNGGEQHTPPFLKSHQLKSQLVEWQNYAGRRDFKDTNKNKEKKTALW